MCVGAQRTERCSAARAAPQDAGAIRFRSRDGERRGASQVATHAAAGGLSSDSGGVQLPAHAEDLLVDLMRAPLVGDVGGEQTLDGGQTRQVLVRRAKRLAQLVSALRERHFHLHKRLA